MDTALAKVLNGFFKRVYVLTLPRLQARQQALATALRGLEYHFFHGWDRETLRMNELIATGLYSPQRAAAYLPFPMKPQEIALSLSHRDVYEEALKQGDFPVLILEDDVALYPSLSVEALSSAFEELPPDWELCYLGYEKHEHAPSWASLLETVNTYLQRLHLINRLPRSIKRQYPRPFSEHLVHAGVHIGAHAYGLSEAACRRLYEKQRPVCLVADHLLQEMIAVEHMAAFACKEKIFINQSVTGTEASTMK